MTAEAEIRLDLARELIRAGRSSKEVATEVNEIYAVAFADVPVEKLDDIETYLSARENEDPRVHYGEPGEPLIPKPDLPSPDAPVEIAARENARQN